ncbi:hypothetical protein I79_017182 [Cricetulus griseus]|uniref:Uncharacterized protein n=1 Tax=Cricetulus griseus TaxID=10029 RepID=G3I1C9_CRIGR|nr:hypothetical protein I79_017182 [Cricetulus griseus]
MLEIIGFGYSLPLSWKLGPHIKPCARLSAPYILLVIYGWQCGLGRMPATVGVPLLPIMAKPASGQKLPSTWECPVSL